MCFFQSLEPKLLELVSYYILVYRFIPRYGTMHDNIFSMPEIVEQNSSQVKDRYLKLIFDFGEIKVNDKRIIDHLAIRKNFSFWWFST